MRTPSDERGQSFVEIAVAMAIMAAVLALAIFVVVPKVRPGESTSQQDAYVRAVATAQARAYVESVATQRADATIGEVGQAARAPAADPNPAQSTSDGSDNGDRREAIMFVALFGVALVALVGGAWFALTRGE